MARRGRIDKSTGLLTLLVLVIGLAAGIVLLRSQQLFGKKAAADLGCGNLGQACCRSESAARYCTGSNLLCYSTKGARDTQCLDYKFLFDANPKVGVVDDPDQFNTKLLVKDANFVEGKVFPFDPNFKNEFKFNCNDSRSRLWLGPYSFDKTVKRDCGWNQYGDYIVQVSARDESRRYSYTSPEIWIHVQRRDTLTPTPTPKPKPTSTPTPFTKKPIGAVCNGGAECISNICKDCGEGIRRCVPSTICPI